MEFTFRVFITVGFLALFAVLTYWLPPASGTFGLDGNVATEADARGMTFTGTDAIAAGFDFPLGVRSNVLPRTVGCCGSGCGTEKYFNQSERAKRASFGIGCVKGRQILLFVFNDLRDGWTNLGETFRGCQVCPGE